MKKSMPIIVTSLLSAAGAALTLTAYKKRQNDERKQLDDADMLERKQEEAVAIAKVLEGDWQARMALAWKMINEDRTHEVSNLICLETLEPKEQKQQEQKPAKSESKTSDQEPGDSYVWNSKESDEMDIVKADRDSAHSNSTTLPNFH
ncbi:hypothetical protein V1498_01690 [Peribacillus sp. SCS-26]|uniref:hypothetical protein n=1 Tax=Paraperibacillus marinus TaxID=3115295 RepID=UPI003905D4DA